MKKFKALLFLTTSIIALGASSELNTTDVKEMTPAVRAIIEKYKKENEELKKIIGKEVNIKGGEEAPDEKIEEGVKKEQWAFSSRTYIEREDYSLPGNDFGNTEDIFMLGVGVSAVKGKLGLHLNTEQRMTGTMNSNGADNLNTRNDYKVRYQLTDEVGVHFKYRSERGNKKRDAYAAEQNRNRDRFELGTDFNLYEGMWSGWLVGGHDIDSQKDNKNKGNYYEGDMGPTFQVTEKLALRPTVYSTGEFYDNNDETMLDHQLRLMAIYQCSENLTLMPRVRYSLSRTLEEDSYSYRYDSDYRVRAEFLFNYVLTASSSIDGGIAYDWQDRNYKRKDSTGRRYDETKSIDMLWYTLGFTYSF